MKFALQTHMGDSKQTEVEEITMQQEQHYLPEERAGRHEQSGGRQKAVFA